MVVFPDEQGHRCAERRFREAAANDPVYLTTQDSTWSAAVEDVLTQHDIPCLKRAALGPAITAQIGHAMEKYRFFVPFGAFEKAKELLAEIIA